MLWTQLEMIIAKLNAVKADFGLGGAVKPIRLPQLTPCIVSLLETDCPICAQLNSSWRGRLIPLLFHPGIRQHLELKLLNIQSRAISGND
jgi:hypothetical protein